MPNLIHTLKDLRIECDSTLISMEVERFLKLVKDVYESKGGIEGQRPALKTKTAKTIRARLVDDVAAGAVIPPIVLGVLCDPETRKSIVGATKSSEVIGLLEGMSSDALSIIDGMQRTTALIEASASGPKLLKQEIRVEIWSSEKIGSLIYRMLILNTGQVPWEIARQLETVYSQLISVIQRDAPDGVEIFLKDDERRRRSPGQYQASTVVRLFLAFSARRAEFDLKDRVAEDFARLDAIESSSHNEFVDYFTRTFSLMVSLDLAFAKTDQQSQIKGARILSGKEFFRSEPALVGLFVAVALALFDEPGFKVDWAELPRKIEKIEASVMGFAEKLKSMQPDEIEEFLQLDVLNERLNQRSGQVGRFERDLFVRAFLMLIERGGDLQDMTPCWLR